MTCGSMYFRGTAGQSYKTRMTLVNTDASATEGTSTTFTATGGWQLLTPSPLAVAAGETANLVREAITINGQRADTFWIAHPMLEAGHAVVAPYVATSGGATATKPGARIQAPATLLTAAQGWVAMRVRMGWAQTQAGAVSSGLNVPVFLWTNTASGVSSKYIWGYVSQTSGNFGTQSSNVSGSDGGASTTTPAYVAGQYLTVIFAWDASYLYTSVNGGSLTAGEGVRAHGVQTGMSSSFEIGDIGLSRWFDSSIIWLATGTGTLTDADAATINGFGSSDPTRSQFPATAQATMVWDGVSSTGNLK
jgi:hypothetical protein